MSDVWVVNASPLIALGRIECLRLLADLSGAILISERVLAEVEAGLQKDRAQPISSLGQLPSLHPEFRWWIRWPVWTLGSERLKLSLCACRTHRGMPYWTTARRAGVP